MTGRNIVAMISLKDPVVIVETQNIENIGVAPIAPLNSVSRVETLRHGKKSEEL